MKTHYLIILLVFMTGCAVSTAPSTPQSSSGSAAVTQNILQEKVSIQELTPIQQVAVGMTISEVQQVMGDHVVIGFKFREEQGSYETIQIPAPYKEEELIRDGETYQILYYFTHIEKKEGLVADDELTPLVFQSGNLIAKGWDAYFRYKIPF